MRIYGRYIVASMRVLSVKVVVVVHISSHSHSSRSSAVGQVTAATTATTHNISKVNGLFVCMRKGNNKEKKR